METPSEHPGNRHGLDLQDGVKKEAKTKTSGHDWQDVHFHPLWKQMETSQIFEARFLFVRRCDRLVFPISMERNRKLQEKNELWTGSRGVGNVVDSVDFKTRTAEYRVSNFEHRNGEVPNCTS
jgi:hypothetical protein